MAIQLLFFFTSGKTNKSKWGNSTSYIQKSQPLSDEFKNETQVSFLISNEKKSETPSRRLDSVKPRTSPICRLPDLKYTKHLNGLFVFPWRPSALVAAIRFSGDRTKRSLLAPPTQFKNIAYRNPRYIFVKTFFSTGLFCNIANRDTQYKWYEVTKSTT